MGKTPLDGACEPYLDRWTFDLGAKVCRPYKTSYNSGGIVNSFLSQRDCQTTCHVHIPQERRCLAKLEIGQDITVVPDRCMPPKRFRFNEATARCEDFSRFGKQTTFSHFNLDFVYFFPFQVALLIRTAIGPLKNAKLIVLTLKQHPLWYDTSARRRNVTSQPR